MEGSGDMKTDFIAKNKAGSLWGKGNSGSASGVFGLSVSGGAKRSSLATKKMNFSASGTMARIARAKTKSQTAAIERYLRAQLREAKQCNCDDTILKAIKKTISKAGSKVKALGREERMENMQKSAAAGGNFQEEARLMEELNRKRQARKRKEKADIIQARLEDSMRKDSSGTVRASGKTVGERQREKLREETEEVDVFESSCEGVDLPPEVLADMGAGMEGAVVDVLL